MKFILLITLLISACSSSAEPVTVAAESPSPAVQPTANIEQQRGDAQIREDQDRAIKDFIVKHYKGWSLAGIAPPDEFCRLSDTATCDLHLTNGAQNKIVPVLMREFVRPTGGSYWLVFEARAIDLLNQQLDSIKSAAREGGA